MNFRFNFMKNFWIWLWRSWSFLLLIPIVVIHVLMINLPCLIKSQSFIFLCLPNQNINKLISILMQLGGGLIVLYSIAWVLKKQNLFHHIFHFFKEYVAQCPIIIRKSIELEGSCCVQTNMSAVLSVSEYKIPETIEEKIELLFKEIEKIKVEHKDALSEISDNVSYSKYFKPKIS